jgi:NADPH-dependent 2,4-dienoyl-CoA reductase/sulfur reductase-like enzyme
MSTTRHTRLLIIGSGPAGYTAAVYAARAMLNPILVQGIQPGGQLTITTEVENWPGDTHVMGPDLMVRMQAHAEAMGAEVISDHISSLDLSARPFTAHADSGITFTADAVILATGHLAEHDPDSAEGRAHWAALARTGQPIVIYMGMANLRGIAEALGAGGLPAETPVAVVAAATLPEQSVLTTDLGRVVEAVAAGEVAAPAIVVVGPIVALRSVLENTR